MTFRGLTAAALGLCALSVPASAQIIATSIPREGTGGAAGAEKKFALHLMASPFAKWKINSYVEDPKGADLPAFQSASATDSSSKFIFAAEAAFAAGSDVTIGIGGWYNGLGEPDVDVLELDYVNEVAFYGTATAKMNVSELHGNIFYKSIGIQVGAVRTSSTVTGFLAGATLEEPDVTTTFTQDVKLSDLGIPEEKDTTTNWDAFLVYKQGAPAGSTRPWGVSVGAGMYRDTETKSSVFSGFVTGSVGIWKGLGIDASYWYVGGKKQTTARRDLERFLEEAVPDSTSRFTVGIGYTF